MRPSHSIQNKHPSTIMKMVRKISGLNMQSIIVLFPNFLVLDSPCFQYSLYLSQEVIKFLKLNLIMHITSKYMQTQR